ncbi:MAG: AAA family ATPase [Candidatus Obscuribacterales bacterium]|nr:AAA family ATPase [Candidatus Obscuribacterales bacterium]
MPTGDQLKKLLAAHRDNDEITFRKTALSIISDETAANRHALARDLKKALGEIRQNAALLNFPRDNARGSVKLSDSRVTADKLILGEQTSPRILRVLEEHKSQQVLAQFGYSPKRKLLFWGPPGCGKTLTAYFLAHELGLQIGTVRLSSLISSYLGDTAAHLDSVFEMANKTPMVLLLDEVDALGKSRDDSNDVGEVKRVVNSMLQCMDTFSGNKSILIAASNHEYMLDPALWRRFDDVIEFPLPTNSEIEKDLKRLLSGVPVDGRLSEVVGVLKGFSFADIEKITIESIKTMILENRAVLSTNDIFLQINNYKLMPSTRS